MRNCFEGYLTEGCKDCPDWRDGTRGMIGCATHYPIDWCPYFKKMMEDDAKREIEERKKMIRRERYQKHFNKKRA